MYREKNAGADLAIGDPRNKFESIEDISRSQAPKQDSSVPQLRLYQQGGVDAIRVEFGRGAKRVLFQLPTGGGKTVTFAYIIAAAVAKGSRVLVLVHRIELVEQIACTLARFGLRFGIIAAGYPAEPDTPVQVASIQTLVRRLGGIAGYAFDFVVVDEAHHTVAGMWTEVLDALPGVKVLGVTATPERCDGKGLGDQFEVLLTGPTMRWLIDNGFLAPYVAYGPSKPPDLSGIKVTAGDYNVGALAGAMSAKMVIKSTVDEYTRICPGVRVIVFAVNVQHSELLVEAFRAGGYTAEHLDGETPRDIRRAVMADFRDGKVQVLCNCQLFDEGLDVAGVEGVIIARPTMSLSRYLQMVGRALRPGKPKAYILDHGGCVAAHGLPDADRKWSLEGRPKEDRRSLRDRGKRCEECGAISPPGATHCVECGNAFERQQVTPIDVDSTLVEIKPSPALAPKLAPAPARFPSRWVSVRSWSFKRWDKNGKVSLCVEYHCGNLTFREWIAVGRAGYASYYAARKWLRLGGDSPVPSNVTEALNRAGELTMPSEIRLDHDGQRYQVTDYRAYERVRG